MAQCGYRCPLIGGDMVQMCSLEYALNWGRYLNKSPYYIKYNLV